MAHVDNLRRHFPAVRHVTYLDTATSGALSDAAADAMQVTLARQLAEGHTADAYHSLIWETKQRIREQFAGLFHADANCFALMESTTEGMNKVLWGFPFAPYDEIIVTDTEHSGALLPVLIQKQRRQIVVKVMDGNLPPQQFIASMEAALSPRTRLIVVSHVSYETGYRLPLERIVELAHANGTYVAVDGAQGAGAEWLDLTSSGIDFYAFPGHKWLCGPAGTGALYVRKELWSVLELSFIGSAGSAGPVGGGEANARGQSVDPYGTFLTLSDARRYEHSTGSLVQWNGLLASLEFLRVSVGWDYAFSRIRGSSGRLLEQLLDFKRVRIVTPRDLRVGLISFQIDGLDAAHVVKEAKDRSIDIRAIPTKQLARVSTGLYNTEEDLDRFVNLMNQVTQNR